MSFRTSLAAASTATLLAVSGCSVPGSFSLFAGIGTDEKASSREASDADGCETPETCAAQLKILVSDPVRDWIGQPQSADGYATGTRLFAYRALRKKLTCSELKRALDETTAATALLQPARYDNVRTLATTVARELKAEQGKRCSAREKA
jgi:hypothetical protein